MAPRAESPTDNSPGQSESASAALGQQIKNQIKPCRGGRNVANPHASRYAPAMRDRLSKERRSWNMSRIRSKDTTPEMLVRSLLHRLGYRFRLHVRIPIPAKTAERVKAVGHKKAQSARNGSLSASTGERGRVRCRIPCAVSADIILPKHKTAIFVHGCFWHRHRGCKNCTTPTHRRKWWVTKLEGNAARDQVHQTAFRKLGWRVIVIWECQTERPKTLKRLKSRLAI